jgi:hypothetical protein
MSLLEALLTEGWRDPHEVYISLRADGQKGSGTIDDPYDGGTRPGPPLSATLTCNRFEFVVGTQFNHDITSLTPPKQVTITGAVGPAADWFNGVFTVQEILSPLHFVLQFDAAKTGTPPVNLPVAPPDVPYSYNPFIKVLLPNGTNVIAHIYWPVAKVTTTQAHGVPSFGAVKIEIEDENIRSTFAGEYVALGPASTGQSFYYRLSSLPDGNTTASSTVTRIIHRYDEVMRTAPTCSVIHLGPGTFETRGYAPIYISNPNNYTQLHVGYVFRPGQRLLGSGLGASVLKLVLPLDEINQTSAIGNAGHPQAPISEVTDYAEVRDLTIDCNAPGHVAPYGIFPAPVTCGGVGLGGSFMRASRVRVINYCTQGRAECFGLFFFPNLSQPPVFNVIEDCIMEKPGENNTHETSQLGSVGDVYGSGRSPIVRHNYVNSSYSNGVSSERVAIEAITIPTAANQEFTVTTKRPHQRTAGQNVLINLVFRADDHATPHPYFNQPFKIKALDSVAPLTKFKCEFLYEQSAFPDPFPGVYFDPNFPACIGVSFHGPQAASGTGCVNEGNAVFDCLLPVYSDTGSARDMIIRDNYCSNIGVGININYPPDTFDTARGFLGASAIVPENAPEDSGYKHGVFTTIQPHGLSVNNTVTIRESGEANPQTGNAYHGSGLLVKAIRSANQFVYRLANQSVPLPADNCPGRPVFWAAASSISIGTLTFTGGSNPKVTVTTLNNALHNLEDGDFIAIGGTPSDDRFKGFFGPITRDLTLPDTKFSYPVATLNYPSSGTGGMFDKHVAAGVVRNSSVATVTTVSPHGFFLGQVFKVQGAYVNGFGDKLNRFYGVVTVKSFTERTFSYDMKTLPSGTPDPDPSGSVISPTGPVAYAAHWDIRHFVIENNIYDLYASDSNSAFVPRAVSMFGLLAVDIPPYIFPALVYRNNLVRHIDEQPGAIAAGTSDAIYATTIGNGIIENNVFNTGYQPALIYYDSGNLTHMQNQKPDGTLLHGYRSTDSSGPPIDDLETRVQDALAMALL